MGKMHGRTTRGVRKTRPTQTHSSSGRIDMILNAAFADGVVDLVNEIKRSKDIFYLHFSAQDYTLLLSLSEKEMGNLIKAASKRGIKVISISGGTIKGSNVRVDSMLFEK